MYLSSRQLNISFFLYRKCTINIVNTIPAVESAYDDKIEATDEKMCKKEIHTINSSSHLLKKCHGNRPRTFFDLIEPYIISIKTESDNRDS